MNKITVEPIACSFIKLPSSIESGLKSAKFSNSCHWDIRGFLEQKWVIMGYLDVNWVELKKYLSEEDIVSGCLKFLNQTPEKKKGAKKEPRPKFGKLQMYKSVFKIKFDKPIIIVELITDERVINDVWGSGQTWDGKKVTKKRGRKPKIKTEIEVE